MRHLAINCRGRLSCVRAYWAWLCRRARRWARKTANGRTYGGDLGNTRYSPLDQINASNFDKLQVAWRFKTDNLGPRPEYNLEATPLMVNGVLYSTAGTRRDVVALDAATGEMLWVHGENEGKRGAGRAPPALRPRLRLLDRWPRRAHPLCHARLSAGRAGRQDRHPHPSVRQKRRWWI